MVVTNHLLTGMILQVVTGILGPGGVVPRYSDSVPFSIYGDVGYEEKYRDLGARIC